jgi:hypothetical protein
MAKPTHNFRAPTSAAAAFVALDAAPAQTPLSAVQPASTLAGQPAQKRKTVRRADGRELRKQTIYFETALAKRLAVHCAETDEDMSTVVAASVTHWLDQNR